MNDYEILKHLGLEIRDGLIVFYDDDEVEHSLSFDEIKEITFEKAFIPVEKKLGFWFEKLFVQKRINGVLNSKTSNEDYRDIYELEIELNNHRVLSRKVKDANVFECMEFVKEINQLIIS